MGAMRETERQRVRKKIRENERDAGHGEKERE